MHRLLVFGIAFALLGAIIAPLSATAKQTPATGGGIGIGTSVPIFSQDGSEIGNITINDIQEPFEDYDTAYSGPQRGYHYVLVDATVANTGSRPFPLDPNSFRAIDAEGFVANFAYVSLTEADAPVILEYLDTLAPGTDATGALIFEVFNEASIERIVYSPDYDIRINVLDLRESPAVAGDPVAVYDNSGQESANVTVTGVSDPWEDYEDFDAPSRGTRYVLIDVSVDNIGSNVLSVSPSDFVATDDQGFVVEAAYVSTDNVGLPTFDYFDLEPGGSASGVIAYEVVSGIPVEQITYGDGYSRSIIVADLSEGAPPIPSTGTSVATPETGTTTSSAECQGLEDWVLDLADRVTASADLLDPLQNVEPTDLDPADLRDAADQMTTWADEQANSNPPPAAVEMNNLFVENYFTALASALNKLADAVETDNTITALVAQTEAQAVVSIFEDGSEADTIFADVEAACPNEVAGL